MKNDESSEPTREEAVTRWGKMLVRFLLISLVLILILSLSACGSAGVEKDEQVRQEEAWLDLLSLVPIIQDNTTWEVYINDIYKLRNALGISLPSTDASIEELEQYRLELLGNVVEPNSLHDNHLCGLSRYGDADDWQRTLGFTWANVEQSIASGSPPNQFQIVRGHFNQDDIDEAVRTGPMNDALEVFSYKDIDYYSWFKDNEIHLARRNPVRPLGRGHRLALVNDCVLWVTWTDGLKAMIDCYKGDRSSLAKMEEFQLMVQGLGQLGTYTAYLSTYVKDLTLNSVRDLIIVKLGEANIPDEEIQRYISELSTPPLLEPYEATSIGLGLDEQGYFMAVVLVHATREAAQQNAQSLEQRLYETWSISTREKWIDMIEIVDIWSQDQLTLAKFYMKGINRIYWYEVSFWLMPLLSHK